MRCLIMALIVPALCLGAGGPAGAEDIAQKIPVKVKADKLDYDRDTDVYVAEGHVRVEQQDTVLEADKVVFNNKTGEATAEGNVYLQDKLGILQAEKINVNMNTRAGIIYNGSVFMVKDNLHLKGEKIERRSETVYAVQNGTFTTCDDEAWYLKAKEIKVDLDKYATGKDVSFRIEGLPVLYTPYFLFPVRRQTGLLIPEAGHSSADGFLLKNAFFWAISDYKDMTLYSDYRSELGVGTGVEYRYVNSRDSQGRAFYNYFDTQSPVQNLWQFQFQHREEIAEDLSIRADINLVSDWTYFRTLEQNLVLRSQPYLDSNVFYVERWNTASLALLGQYSTNLTTSNGQTIQKLPEVRYTLYQEQLAGPLHFSFDGAATNFTRQDGGNVQRLDLKPSLSIPVWFRGLTLTPVAGVRGTFYNRRIDYVLDPVTKLPVATLGDEPTERTYYFAGADLTSRISRVFGTDTGEGIGRVRHSIEGAVSYVYVPRTDQTEIPQLDAVDAVTQQNLAIFSLTNRLTAHYREKDQVRTYDMMVFILSQAYDVNKRRSDEPAPRSPLQGQLSFRTPKLLTLSATAEYDTYEKRRTSSSESISVTTKPVRFTVTHQYTREKEDPVTKSITPETQYVTYGGGVKLGPWDLSGTVWQDIERHTTQQQEYRVYYAAQCWGMGVSYITQPGKTQYLFSFDLKGIGKMKM